MSWNYSADVPAYFQMIMKVLIRGKIKELKLDKLVNGNMNLPYHFLLFYLTVITKNKSRNIFKDNLYTLGKKIHEKCA